jgi:hypothetical protein
MEIKGLGLPPISYTTSGIAQADIHVMKALVGKEPDHGLAYKYFK